MCRGNQINYGKRNYKLEKCTNCGNPKCLYTKDTLCSECSKLSKRKVERPPKEVLKEEIKSLGYCGTGRKYGVSDSAIRKWLK